MRLLLAALLAALAAVGGALAPGSRALAEPAKPDLKVSFVPGPYEDAFKDAAETPWARDIASAYRSDAFKAAIRADRFYDGFTLPDYFQ